MYTEYIYHFQTVLPAGPVRAIPYLSGLISEGNVNKTLFM
jgi:hypothetical protein